MKLLAKPLIKKVSLLRIPKLSLGILTLIIFIFGLGLFTGSTYVYKQTAKETQTQTQDKYAAFILESYDKILTNYWENISGQQLTTIYKQATERITGKLQKLATEDNAKNNQQNINSNNPALRANPLAPSLDLQGTSINDLKLLTKQDKKQLSSSREALEKMLIKVTDELEPSKKKEFALTLVTTILSGLQPAGRSGLFTQKQKEQLTNTVQNINPDKDLYQDLGLEKGASEEAVEKAYQQKEAELIREDSPQAREKLKQLSYAKDVLTDIDKKKNYDSNKVEPTISSKEIDSNIAYLKFDKFSPTSYEEFIKSVNSYAKEDGPKALIFDLRGNIGGAIDSLPFFLGNFLGDKQYIYDFLSKSEYESYKSVGTKLAGLKRMRQVVILIDNQTQSSAELLAASLKRYHFGILLGAPTKGWGTVEKIFQLDNQLDENEKYSMLLVHSITLRDDNQPIEGRGVEPDINITSPDWERQVFEYFRYPELVDAVKSVI